MMVFFQWDFRWSSVSGVGWPIPHRGSSLCPPLKCQPTSLLRRRARSAVSPAPCPRPGDRKRDGSPKSKLRSVPSQDRLACRQEEERTRDFVFQNQLHVVSPDLVSVGLESQRVAQDFPRNGNIQVRWGVVCSWELRSWLLSIWTFSLSQICRYVGGFFVFCF